MPPATNITLSSDSDWVWSSDDIPVDSINAIRGTEIARHAQTFSDWLSDTLAVPLSVVEGALCGTYTLCCRDPALVVLAHAPAGVSVLNTTCIVQHEGLTTDIERTLQDPSAPNFCSYVTGAPANLITRPPRGVCRLIDTSLDDFSISTCQAEFCPSGVDAYITFVNQMVALIQRYAVPLAVAMAGLVLFMIIWACNVRYVGKRLSSKQPAATFTANVDGTALPNYPAPPAKRKGSSDSTMYNV